MSILISVISRTSSENETLRQRNIEDNYQMNHAKRGMAIIFHHDKFDDDKSRLYQLATRTNSASQRDRLSETLTKLKFEVEFVENKTWKEIQEKMEDGKMSLEYSKETSKERCFIYFF